MLAHSGIFKLWHQSAILPELWILCLGEAIYLFKVQQIFRSPAALEIQHELARHDFRSPWALTNINPGNVSQSVILYTSFSPGTCRITCTLLHSLIVQVDSDLVTGT